MQSGARVWWVSMRPVMKILMALVAGAASACASPDCACPLGQTCDAQGQCTGQCEQDQDCPMFTCAPDLECCDPNPVCAAGTCLPRAVPPDVCGTAPAMPDGWDDPPGAGTVFVVSRVAIASQAVVDVDGRCGRGGCLENALGRVGEFTNDQLRQFLLGGEMLYGVEIAGLDEDYAGFDRSITVKLYALRDADDPFFPANNFRVPTGHTECCQFLIHPQTLDGQVRPQPRARMAARIRNARIETLPGQAPAFVTVAAGLPPWADIELDRPQLSAALLPNLAGLDDLRISGAFSARSLSQICNPYCRVQSPLCPFSLPQGSTLLELVSYFAGYPDMDVDGDGIECVYDRDGDGTVETCCEGTGAQQCDPTPCAAPAPAADPAVPSSCARASGINDGYSVTFEMQALPATLVGVAP